MTVDEARLARARAALVRASQGTSAGTEAPSSEPPAPTGEQAGESADPTVGLSSADTQAYAAAKRWALRSLAVAPRSRAHLETVLATKQVEPDIAKLVLDRLTQVGLIDDHAYAEVVVRSARANRGLARRALTQELKKRGVDDQTADEALQVLDEGSEYDAARRLVDKRLRTMSGLEVQVVRRRLAGMLARKGYDAATAYRVIGDCLHEHPAFRRD